MNRQIKFIDLQLNHYPKIGEVKNIVCAGKHEHIFTKIIYENGVKFYQCSVKNCMVIDLER